MTEVFPVAFLKGPVYPLNWGAVRPECVCRPTEKIGGRATQGPFCDTDSFLFYEAAWLEGAGLMR